MPEPRARESFGRRRTRSWPLRERNAGWRPAPPRANPPRFPAALRPTAKSPSPPVQRAWRSERVAEATRSVRRRASVGASRLDYGDPRPNARRFLEELHVASIVGPWFESAASVRNAWHTVTGQARGSSCVPATMCSGDRREARRILAATDTRAQLCHGCYSVFHHPLCFWFQSLPATRLRRIIERNSRHAAARARRRFQSTPAASLQLPLRQ